MQGLDHMQRSDYVQAHEHLRCWPNLSEFTELYYCDMLAEPDLRPALLMLGSAELRRTDHMRW